MKSSLSRIVLFVLFFNVQVVANAEKVISICAKTGEVLSFSLNDYASVAFDSDNILVKLKDNQLEFPLSDYVTFKVDENHTKSRSAGELETEIHAATTASIKIGGSRLSFQNLPPGYLVRFYSLSGTLLDSAKADGSGVLFYDIVNLPKQVIVIQAYNKSFKIRL
jgi:hypothetical protein